jgi:hypothetical protein
MPPTQDQVNDVWGQSKLTETQFLTLPSGQTCQAKPIGMEGVFQSGIMGAADSLTAYVGKEYIRKVRGAKGKADAEEINVQALMKDPAALGRIVLMVDTITPLVVTEPEVIRHFVDVEVDGKKDTRKIPEDERVCRECGVMRKDHDPEIRTEVSQHHGWITAIYTDMIGMEDKMFLFHFALSGVRDVESFREAASAAMGTVEDGESVPVQAQSTGRPGGKRRRPPRRG